MQFDSLCYSYSYFQEFPPASGRICFQHFRENGSGFLLHINVLVFAQPPTHPASAPKDSRSSSCWLRLSHLEDLCQLPPPAFLNQMLPPSVPMCRVEGKISVGSALAACSFPGKSLLLGIWGNMAVPPKESWKWRREMQWRLSWCHRAPKGSEAKSSELWLKQWEGGGKTESEAEGGIWLWSAILADCKAVGGDGGLI